MEKNSEAHPFRTLASHYLLQSPWRSLRQDRVAVGDDHEITYNYLEAPRAVFIVPLTEDGQIVLIRQYRYPVRDWLLEIPGGSPDRPGEDTLAAAYRELREETGGECREMRYLATFYICPPHLNVAADIYLATGVRLGEPRPEQTEFLERLALPARAALELARAGRITDGQSAYALLLAEPHILALVNDKP